jgi:hypothetical protein
MDLDGGKNLDGARIWLVWCPNHWSIQMGSRRDASIVADFVLLLVAFVWGFTFIMVKEAIAEVGVYPFLFLRFTLSFIFMILIFAKRLPKLNKSIVFSGSVLGVFLFLGYAFQTTGLAYTSASNAPGSMSSLSPSSPLSFSSKSPSPLPSSGLSLPRSASSS